eukprot:CAMPEP_0117423934 /NCGR_PEP_ID=MMETSP0758-20121206/4456_1 /TAXON_ID=63605 /ORGANISM="Percolomonas cosmopolitus, Strain AE-1 (ATCC 50343)" /LENGTH=63 /DNA_ID=CAMNT_0005207415 /DNA_START=582 /DNA_END=774 /DNA_ORIENTATION=-
MGKAFKASEATGKGNSGMVLLVVGEENLDEVHENDDGVGVVVVVVVAVEKKGDDVDEDVDDEG